jgi:hypothetical protein
MHSNISDLELKIREQEMSIGLFEILLKLSVTKDKSIYNTQWKNYLALLTKLTEVSVYGNH